MAYDHEYYMAVCQSPLGIHRLKTLYDEGCALQAIGGVYIDEPISINVCLGANTQINAIWASPEGHLWAGDRFGDIFTNAPVTFMNPPDSELEFSGGIYQIDWKVTQTDMMHDHACIWGSSDSDIWFLSYNGDAVHWDGKTFSTQQVIEKPNKIHGSASDDIYAVGWNGAIAHWNGSDWQNITPPDGIPAGATFTGVRVINRDTVYICSSQGPLLVGNARDGFTDIGSPEYRWYGLGYFQNRLFLAGGPKGVFELIDGKIVSIKDNVRAVGVWETKDAVYFIPDEQKPKAWVARYTPGDEKPWKKLGTL